MKTFATPSEIKVPDLFNFRDTDGRLDLEAYGKAETDFIGQVSEFAKGLEPHKLAGEVVSVPFADGSASYVVAKLDGKVSLIHLPIGDEWRDARFERTATVAELTRLVEQAKALRKLWAKR